MQVTFVKRKNSGTTYIKRTLHAREVGRNKTRRVFVLSVQYLPNKSLSVRNV